MSKSISNLWKKPVYIHDFSDWELDWILEEKDNDSRLLDFLSNSNKTFEVEKIRVTANIATHPGRFESLLQMLESIDGQFDEIRIYLNEFTSIPKDLEKYTTYIGKNITDNGKFFWCHNQVEYYFTLDDDLIYPPDYVSKTLPLIGDRIVTYHGRQLRGINRSYYNDHKLFSFKNQLLHEKVIDVGGTGLMAFNTRYFQPELWKKDIYKMSDLLIALDATLSSKSIICLPKKSDWILEIQNEDIEDSIHLEFLLKHDQQNKICDMIQMYRETNKKFDDKYKSTTLTKDSVEKIQQLLEKFQNIDTIYNIGFGNPKLLVHFFLSESPYKNLIGIDTSVERSRIANFFLKDLEISENCVKIITQKFDKIKFKTGSVIIMNDFYMKLDQVQSIFDNLTDNNVFITSKILSTFPEEKINVELSNEEFVTYYIYKTENVRDLVKSPYEKSYVINAIGTEEGEKRWKNILQVREEYHNLERFQATMGKKDDWNNYVTETWNKGWFLNDSKKMVYLSNSEIGCCMSHLRVWKKILQDNINVALILEDDASNVIPNLNEYLNYYFDLLPKDWDIFLVGFHTYNSPSIKITQDIYKVKRFILSHSYIINKRAIEKLMSLLPINMPFDTYLSSLSESGKLNIYRHNFTEQIDGKHGALVRQSSDKSLIEHTNQFGHTH